MFRTALSAVCRSGECFPRLLAASVPKKSVQLAPLLAGALQQRGLLTLSNASASASYANISIGLKSLQLLDASAVGVSQQQARSVTKFSLRKGKRKSVKAVLHRFKRLHWGGWIRTRAGRSNSMHRKSGNRKRRLRQHVMVNSSQAHKLDKMVTKFWKRPKHYIDDPYEPYHARTFLLARRTPQPMQERVK